MASISALELRGSGHVVKAYFLAALTGGGVIGLEFVTGLMAIFLYTVGISRPDYLADPIPFDMAGPIILGGVSLGLFATLYATLAFAVGLAVIGGPVWLLMHGLGWRSRRACIIAGAVLSGSAQTLAIFSAGLVAIPVVAAVAVAGAVAGHVLHRVAYRPRSIPA